MWDEFQNQPGYRLVLRRFSYPNSAKAGAMMLVASWWVNKGVAPVYGEYRLAFAIDKTVMPANVDLKKWLPGDQVFDGPLYVPESVKPGSHKIRVGILDARTGEPAIHLAIEGRQADGWYELGAIDIR